MFESGIDLINQICNQSKLSGSELDALRARLELLSEEDLQAELRNRLVGENSNGEIGLIVESSGVVEDSFFVERGESKEFLTYNGEELSERRIVSADTDGNIFQQVITYENSKPTKLVKIKNGNTVSTTTFAYNEDGENSVPQVTLKTENSDRSTVITNAITVDDDGNVETENIIDRVVTTMDGTVTTVSVQDDNLVEQIETFDGKRVVTTYNGHDINAYDAGQLNRLSQQIEQNGEVYYVEYDGNGNTKTTVQNNEVPSMIARRFNVSLDDINRLNTGSGLNAITQVGAGVIIPGEFDADSEVMLNRLSKDESLARFRRYALTPETKASQEDVDRLTAYGFNPSNENKVFYQKFAALDENKKTEVLGLMATLQSHDITDSIRIKSEILKNLGINLFDSDKTIPLRSSFNHVNLIQSQSPIVSSELISLESFVTEILGQDINSELGERLYARLNGLSQEELNKISVDDFVDNVTGRKKFIVTDFDQVAARFSIYGIELHTEDEIRSTLNSPKYMQKQERIKLRQIAVANIAIVYDQAIATLRAYQNSQGVLNVGYWREILGNLIKNDFVPTSMNALIEHLEEEKQACIFALDFNSQDYNAFNNMFKYITGVDYDEEKMKNFINEAQKEGGDWQSSYKAAFGSRVVNWANSFVSQTAQNEAILDVVLMLIGTDAIASTSAYQGTVRGISTQVGKVATEKTTNIVTSMAAGGLNAGSWTLLSSSVNNITAPGIDATSWDTWENTFIGTLESVGIGAVGGLLNETIVSKVVKKLERPSAKALGIIDDAFRGKTSMSGAEIMVKYAENASPGYIANIAGFLVEAVGFTAYETALDICKEFFSEDGFNEDSMRRKLIELGKDANEVNNLSGSDLISLYLRSSFVGQLKSLAEIKTISNLLLMTQGGKASQQFAYAERLNEYESLRDIQVRKITVDSQELFEITCPNGKYTVNSMEKVVYTCDFLMRAEGVNQIENLGASYEVKDSEGNTYRSPFPTEITEDANLFDVLSAVGNTWGESKVYNEQMLQDRNIRLKEVRNDDSNGLEVSIYEKGNNIIVAVNGFHGGKNDGQQGTVITARNLPGGRAIINHLYEDNMTPQERSLDRIYTEYKNIANAEGKNLIVAGYSIGGAMTRGTAIRHPMDNTTRFIGFNSLANGGVEGRAIENYCVDGDYRSNPNPTSLGGFVASIPYYTAPGTYHFGSSVADKHSLDAFLYYNGN